MDQERRTLRELVKEIEQAVEARGQSVNAVSQYHYIYSVFIAYSKSYNERYFSKDILERCLREHYGIGDEKLLSRKQHYKKKVLRAYRLLADRNEDKPFIDRYTDTAELLNTQLFIDAVTAFGAQCEKNGLSPKTIATYQRYANYFLTFAEQSGVTRFEDFTGELIQQYTLTLSRFRKCTIKSTLGSTRIFFRFLYTHEYTARDLSGLVISLKIRTQTKIPSVWKEDEVLRLLAAIDRGNPSGKRDYAILLLAARMGIRVGDIVNLKLDDFDWSQKTLEFVQNKTKHRVRLPLLRDVGWSIIDYVNNGRPKVDSRFVFMTHVPPFKAYAQDNHLHRTIQKYMTIAGIQCQSPQKRGMHSLRHTLANRLLGNLESAQMISSTLGHSSPDSSAVYIKTDIELLRECALSPSEVGL